MYPRIIQKLDSFLVKTIYKYANRKWYADPLAKNSETPEAYFIRQWENAKAKEYKPVDEMEQNIGTHIDYDWYHKLALHTQVVKKESDICYVHGRLLYVYVKKYLQEHSLNSLNVLETGTARGFSALCMAKALEDEEREGKIITFDVLPHNHKMYWNCIDDRNGKQTRDELLRNYDTLIGRYLIFHQGSTKTELSKLYLNQIHFAFLDAAHDYYHLMTEFDFLKNRQKKGDIIFFDDYTPALFPGVVKAVDEICRKYNYAKEIIRINDRRIYLIATKQ